MSATETSKRNFAYLDSKTGLRVLCGSCYRYLARIESWVDEKEGVMRALLLGREWLPRKDGVWTLTSRGEQRKKSHRRASVRGERNLVKGLAVNVASMECDLAELGIPEAEKGHWRVYRLLLCFPARMLCSICKSEQLLDLKQLRVRLPPFLSGAIDMTEFDVVPSVDIHVPGRLHSNISLLMVTHLHPMFGLPSPSVSTQRRAIPRGAITFQLAVLRSGVEKSITP